MSSSAAGAALRDIRGHCSWAEPLRATSRMPGGGDARTCGQGVTPTSGSTYQGSVSSGAGAPQVGAGASSPHTLPFTLFREGESMHGVALDDEFMLASRQAASAAPVIRGGSFTEFVLVEWADVPDQWRAAGAAATVAVVLPDRSASRSYARWYWETNTDARITCIVCGGYERAYGAVATRVCLRRINAEGLPTLRFVQLWL